MLTTQSPHSATMGRLVRHLPAKYVRLRGAVLVWIAVLSIVMIAFVGLLLDTAKVALVFHQMQNASDAAALAGATIVRGNRANARLQAQTIAQTNSAEGKPLLLNLNTKNNPNGDIVIGWYNRHLQTFTPSAATVAANAMAVIAIRSKARANTGGPVGLTFGPIAGVHSVDINGAWQQKGRPYAIAMAAGGTGAGLIALVPTGTGLYMNGNFTLNVQPLIPPATPTDGEIQVNSASWNALDVDGASTQIKTTALNITGGMDVSNNFSITAPYTTGAPPIPDPLAWLPAPTWNPVNDLTSATKMAVGDTSGGSRIEILTGTHTLSPGYYSGGFYLGSRPGLPPPTVNFQPGVYVLGGSSGGQTAGLVIYSGARVLADEAMFYITGDGIVHIQGTGIIQATEPTAATWGKLGYPTVYDGVTIFQDRANSNSAYIRGTADLDLNGTLYFPSADPVNIRGGGWGFGNQLIGHSFDIRGSGIVGIDYDGRNRSRFTRSFLVE